MNDSSNEPENGNIDLLGDIFGVFTPDQTDPAEIPVNLTLGSLSVHMNSVILDATTSSTSSGQLAAHWSQIANNLQSQIARSPNRSIVANSLRNTINTNLSQQAISNALAGDAASANAAISAIGKLAGDLGVVYDAAVRAGDSGTAAGVAAALGGVSQSER